MTIVRNLGSAFAFITYLALLIGSLVGYFYHFAFTIMYSFEGAHVEYMAWLVAGIFFPPLGIAHSVILMFV